LRDVGQIDESLQACREGAKRYPDLAWLNGNLGIALRYKGDFVGAIEAMKAATAAEPKNADLWALLGDTQTTFGDKNAAIASFKKALEINPANPSAKSGLERAKP
jgi:Flp pilus assembly protein TadD